MNKEWNEDGYSEKSRKLFIWYTTWYEAILRQSSEPFLELNDFIKHTIQFHVGDMKISHVKLSVLIYYHCNDFSKK